MTCSKRVRASSIAVNVGLILTLKGKDLVEEFRFAYQIREIDT